MRRRLYTVSQDMRRDPSDCKLLNDHDALEGGIWRKRKIFTHSTQQWGVYVGVPSLKVKPRVQVGKFRKSHLDIYGYDRRYVSTRGKALLEAIDKDAFEFAECDTIDRSGSPIDPYWIVDVVRVLDIFDEGRSSFVTMADRYSSQIGNPNICELNDIYLAEDTPDDAHAFYFSKYMRHFIFDEVIADAWRAAKLTGAILDPLQPPLKSERAQILHFYNSNYWASRIDQ